MFQIALLNIRRFVRSAFFPVSILVLVLITVFVLLLPTVSEEARARISLEAFFFLLTIFLSFIGVLAASRTIASDRRTGALLLVATKPIRPHALVVGTFLGIGGVILAVALIAFLFARLLLPLTDMRVRHPKVADDIISAQMFYRGSRYALQFTPAGNPIINSVEVARILTDTERKIREKRLLYLTDDNPQLIWFFQAHSSVRGIVLSAIVLHAEETKAHLCILHNGRIIYSKKITVQNEIKKYIPLQGVVGKVLVAISLTPGGEPLAFRLWLNESGYERTGIMLVTSEVSITFGVFICVLLTALKAITLVAFGIFCASFLSPAISSILATFLFFLSSANRFILQSATSLPSLSHAQEAASQSNMLYVLVHIVIEAVCYITPKLTLYSPETTLASGFTISTRFVLSAFYHYGLYIPLLLVLATLVYGPILRRGEGGD